MVSSMHKHIAMNFGLSSWACYSELTPVALPKPFQMTGIPDVKINSQMIPVVQQKVKITSASAPLAVATPREASCPTNILKFDPA
jgi:hypothetical protein